MIAREVTEIAIFSFAGKYSITPVVLGLTLSIGLVLLINNSLIKVNKKNYLYNYPWISCVSSWIFIWI